MRWASAAPKPSPPSKPLSESIQKRAARHRAVRGAGRRPKNCAPPSSSCARAAAGYNPFIVIIVTAWEKSTGLINRVVNSGADDLLLRPFSTALLGQRIEAHIERRKGFVITTDYVGPDRRKDASRAVQCRDCSSRPIR